MVYYSQLIGKPVIAKDFRVIGKVNGLAFIDGHKYAKISAIVCRTKKGIKKIPWRYVIELGDKINDTRFKVGIYLNATEDRVKYSSKKGLLLNDILDKQILDVDGVRIIRVNDVLLGEIEGRLCVVGVDVSTKGMMRRVGLIHHFSELLPILEEHIIPWRYVAPLHKRTGELHVKCKMNKLVNLHPADLADAMNDLSADERVLVFNSLDRKKAAETLIVSQPDVKKSVFKGMNIKKIAELLEHMPHNEAAAILTLMPSIRNETILRLMSRKHAASVRKILSYSRSSAGAIMSTDFLAIPDYFSIRQAIAFLRKEMPKPNKIHYFYIKDKSNQLVGVVSLRDILLSKPKDKVLSVIKRNVLTVNVDTHVDEAFNIMNKYSLLALPVLSKDKKIVGVIRISDALNALLPLSIKRQRIPHKYKRKRQNGKNKP
jgi:CBS domain-containing protein